MRKKIFKKGLYRVQA